MTGGARRVWDPTIIAVEASHWRVRARLGNPTLAKNIPNPRLLLLLSSFSIRRRLLSSSPLGGSPPHVLLPAPAPCSPPRSSATRGSEEETGGCFTSWGPGRRRSEDKGTGWWCLAAEARCTRRRTEHAGGRRPDATASGRRSTRAGTSAAATANKARGWDPSYADQRRGTKAVQIKDDTRRWRLGRQALQRTRWSAFPLTVREIGTAEMRSTESCEDQDLHAAQLA